MQIIHAFKDSEVFLIKIPYSHVATDNSICSLDSSVLKIGALIKQMSLVDNINKTLIILGPLETLPYIYHLINKKFLFKRLIAIRLKKLMPTGRIFPNEHIGALIMTTKKYKSLNEVKKPFQYCKACKRTLKDYGGKEHLLMSDGTRISDVWTDVMMNANGAIPDAILERLFSLTSSKNSKLVMLTPNATTINKWKITPIKDPIIKTSSIVSKGSSQKEVSCNSILNTDALSGLSNISDDIIDLALIDPPYNLRIKYGEYTDDMKRSEYLKWSKKWIDEIARTLRPGGMMALVNIPVWALELFPHLQQRLNFYTWIVWDSFSYPHSPIIPAHYPILCFTKGNIKPTLVTKFKEAKDNDYDLMHPLNHGYCIRSKCINLRSPNMIQDRKDLSDLWTDIHRIRHNSFRYNHPTLMPQRLAKRIILAFSEINDTVLDCFNGVGTTSLVASLLGRKYIGIEKNPAYYETSIKRHDMLDKNKNPFARREGGSTSAAKKYRVIKHKTCVNKKTLQNDVKNIAIKLGHVPTKSELQQYGTYPMKYYFDSFVDWAEITVAARRTELGSNKGQKKI